MVKNKAIFILLVVFAGYGALSFVSELVSINTAYNNNDRIIKEISLDVPQTAVAISETTAEVKNPTVEETTAYVESSVAETEPENVPAAAIQQPTTAPQQTNTALYDFGYNTDTDTVRYNSDYLTANVQYIKENGLVGSQVNVSGQFTYAGHGYSVSDMSWYDSNSMSQLDSYYINDAYGEGKYIVLSAYPASVFADQYVTVYGTVIDIDRNGVVYIAGQLIETAPTN